jgi:hypothetical protein
MAISTQKVSLDCQDDGEGVLIFRDGRFLGVACRLGDLHGELSGSWFIEAAVGACEDWRGATFATLAELEKWAENELPSPVLHARLR